MFRLYHSFLVPSLSLILFGVGYNCARASQFTNNTQDLWLYRAPGQAVSCPLEIAPKQVVDFGVSNYYCGYDICSSNHFDQDQGCLEKSGFGSTEQLTQGGFGG